MNYAEPAAVAAPAWVLLKQEGEGFRIEYVTHFYRGDGVTLCGRTVEDMEPSLDECTCQQCFTNYRKEMEEWNEW